jgi:hypothetical protein
MLPIDRNDDEKFSGHKRCTHRVVSEQRGGQDGWYEDRKKKEEGRSR